MPTRPGHPQGPDHLGIVAAAAVVFADVTGRAPRAFEGLLAANLPALRAAIASASR